MAKLIDITGKAISGEWGTDDLVGNGVPVLRTTNFTNIGVVNFNNVVTRQIVKKSIGEKLLRYGDIIIEKSGGSDKQPVGRVVFFEGEENKYLFNNFTGLLRVRDFCEWNPKYIFYSLFANYAKGGTIPFENRTTGLHNLQTDSYVNNVMIVERKIEEQTDIVTILDKVNQLINYEKKQLEDLDILVKSRFIEMFGDKFIEVTADSVCSEIVDCPHSTPQYNEDSLIYPAIRTSEIQNGKIKWSTMKYVGSKEYEKRIKRLKPLAGDIVYAREGTYGDCVILPRGFEFCLGQRTMLFRPDFSICNSEYLYTVLRSEFVKKQADKSNAGSTVPHVNVADAKQFRFPLPPIELQNQFASFVMQVDKSKLAIQQSLDELETLKKSLMQQYFG